MYKFKDSIVEAHIFDGSDDSVEWLLYELVDGEIGRAYDKLYFKSSKGTLTGYVGDYIVKDMDGNIFPLHPDIFDLLTEEYDESKDFKYDQYSY